MKKLKNCRSEIHEECSRRQKQEPEKKMLKSGRKRRISI
jgi:hypothetical protein